MWRSAGAVKFREASARHSLRTAQQGRLTNWILCQPLCSISIHSHHNAIYIQTYSFTSTRSRTSVVLFFQPKFDFVELNHNSGMSCMTSGDSYSEVDVSACIKAARQYCVIENLYHLFFRNAIPAHFRSGVWCRSKWIKSGLFQTAGLDWQFIALLRWNIPGIAGNRNITIASMNGCLNYSRPEIECTR
jgi:hypothetical protein